MPATSVPPPDAHLAFPARPRFLPVRPGPLGDIPAAAGARHANASEFYLLQHRPFVRREGSPRPDFSIAPYPRESPPGMFSQTRSSAQPSDTFMRGAPFDSNPAVTPPAPKVWILDCKSCGTFLTNRGMKVRSKTFGSRLRRESLALTLDIDPLLPTLFPSTVLRIHQIQTLHGHTHHPFSLQISPVVNLPQGPAIASHRPFVVTDVAQLLAT
jgi:hypothetical protein